MAIPDSDAVRFAAALMKHGLSADDIRRVANDDRLARYAADSLHSLIERGPRTATTEAHLAYVEGILGPRTPRAIVRIGAAILALREIEETQEIDEKAVARVLDVSRQSVYGRLKANGYTIAELMRRLT